MTVEEDQAPPAHTRPSAWEALERAASPIEERPRLIPGVEAVQHATRGGASYVVIHNPAAGTYLRLDPREYDLLPLLDGAHSVKALVVAYYQRHGVLALPRVAGLVRLLRGHRFLQGPCEDTYAALETRLLRAAPRPLLSRLARGFLQAEFTVRGVDAVFGAWYRAWGWLFFTRPAAVAGIVLGLLGPILFLVELGRGRYALFQVGHSYLLGTGLVLALGLVALAIHETGHGLAVKHAGRTVPRVGLLLYYGLPTAYVDTTDVWMAPRRRRLVASFAGPYTGLALGGLSALGAVLLPQGPVGAFLYTWGFVFFVDNMFNFNPLLELDGYYMLVDLLEKPMLRARALRFVRGPLWTRLRQGRRLTGEEVFFALFGLASALYSVLAIVIALRFWEQRVGPLVRDAWASHDGLVRGALIAVAAALCGLVSLMLWGLARRVVLWLGEHSAVVGRRLAARRNAAALAAVRAVPLWSDMPAGWLLEMARALRRRRVAPGAEVVRQGTPGDQFYLIAQGTFEVLVDGKPVQRLGPGDYFGERALLASALRAATVVALRAGRLYTLDRAAFQALLAHDLAPRQRLEAALQYRAEVSAMPLFRDLGPVELDLLLARLVPVTVAAGTAIIRQGQPGDRFYVVRSGAVEVVRDGRRLAVLGPGDAFGEIALLLEVPRTATVQATAPTALLALEAADFRDLLASYCGRVPDLQRLSHARLAAQRQPVSVGDG